MLHICPRVHGQTFDEPPFEEEILAFIQFLGHSVPIRTLADVEHKESNKSNEMYYPRFTKVIIYHFMLKDPSIPRRNKVNWHYVRDDHMRTAPKPKASVRRTISSSDISITHPTATVSPRLIASVKGKQTTKAKSLPVLSEVAMTEAQQLKLVTKRSMQQTHISQPSG
nr:hypothetical protein [Tanacetum cinerariifolium]